jgi:hypothetical protein
MRSRNHTDSKPAQKRGESASRSYGNLFAAGFEAVAELIQVDKLFNGFS